VNTAEALDGCGTGPGNTGHRTKGGVRKQ